MTDCFNFCWVVAGLDGSLPGMLLPPSPPAALLASRDRVLRREAQHAAIARLRAQRNPAFYVLSPAQLAQDGTVHCGRLWCICLNSASRLHAQRHSRPVCIAADRRICSVCCRFWTCINAQRLRLLRLPAAKEAACNIRRLLLMSGSRILSLTWRHRQPLCCKH